MRLKWLLGALIALTSLSAVWFFELPGGLILFPSIALVAAAGARPDAVLRVPAWLWRLGFPALVAATVADYLLNAAVLETLLRLNMLLIVFRAVSPRAKRDDLQLLVLCLFLVVMAGVLTVSLGFAVLILAFTAAGLGFLLLVTLCDVVAPEAAAGAHWTLSPWRAVLSRVFARADWRFIGLAAGMFGATIAMTSLLFLAIPRFEFGTSLGFMGLRTKQSLTGFTDSVAFGDVTDIKQDDSTALRVETSDPGAVPANPYWRMIVLDSYENGRFRVSRSARAAETSSMRSEFTIAGTLAPGERAAQWTFYLEPGVSRYLPLGGTFGAIRLREAARIVQNRKSNVVALNVEPQKMFAYRVEGMEFDGRIPEPEIKAARTLRVPVQEAGAGPGQSAFSRYPGTLLQLAVSDDERAVLERTAAAIGGGRELPAMEFAQRALPYLHARHGYSLQSALPKGTGDPVVRWLESDAPGHCEYFAGALTLLARAAGHPARVVTGFAGGTWNAFEGYFMVRNSDAHAWCEIHDGTDWVRVDPTPGAASAASAANPAGEALRAADRSWSAYIDSLRVVWYRRIVNFDERQQSGVADAVKSLTRRSGERLLQAAVAAMAAIDDWIRGAWDWRRIVRTGLAVLAAAAVLAGGWRTRNLWRAWVGFPGRRGDPVRARAGAWLARLTRAGALETEPDVTLALRRVRFGRERARSHPVELFARARRLVRRMKRPR